MGALASNRKRGENIFSLNGFYSQLPYRADLRIAKKPRVSSMNLSPEDLSSSSNLSPNPFSTHNTVSRIRQYPKPTQGLRREVHAPVRHRQFSKPSNEMGVLFSQVKQAKNLALATFWCARKEKAECSKVVILDDESDEEAAILDTGRTEEMGIGVLEKEPVESNGDAYLKEKYEKFEESGSDFRPSSSGVSYLSNQTLKGVDETGKLLESLSVNRGVEEYDVGMLPHKKLYDSAERRNSKLGHLSFEIDYLTKKLSFFARPTKKPEEDASQQAFIPLTDEEEQEVSNALSHTNRRRVLVKHAVSNIEITGEMMQCLRPGAWLNDEVINVYLELLKEREKRDPKKFLNCHFFNTFFYNKLISGRAGYDYKAVKRWTTPRKLGYGLIECDKIFVPIHKEIHWCLAIINQKEQKFQYLDSLRGRDSKALKVLARYFVDEVKDKSAKDIDVSAWQHEYISDLPEQENGSDCGMFMIKYSDFYSRGLGLIFKQEHMPYFRRRTAKEILRLKAE